MGYLRFLAFAAFSLIFLLHLQPAHGAKLEDIIAAAKTEGVIELYASSSLGAEGTQALAAAFNKKHGLNIKVNYHPSGAMTRDVAKIVGMAASGVPPEWDLMVVTDAHHGSLWTRKLHVPLDYKILGVAADTIQYDSGTVSIANQMILPAYNKKTLPAKDVPKKWEDLLDPKWKDCKLGILSATHHWARLAAGPWDSKRPRTLSRS